MVETLDRTTAEDDRLAALRALDILDSQPEAIFDSLTELAALTFRAPVALISLIDSERQWFKSCVGTDECETPRDIAFCDYTIRQTRPLIIPNALLDPRFSSNPLVTGAPGIRFYAGAPLTSPDGYRLGSLCVIDFEPRDSFSDSDQAELVAMAKAVSVAMQTRRDINEVVAIERNLHATVEQLQAREAQLEFLTENSADLILRVNPESVITWVSPSCSRYGYTPDEVVGVFAGQMVHPDDRPKLAERRPGRFANLKDPDGRREYRIKAKDGSWWWIEENPTIIRNAEGRALEIVNILRDISDRKRAEQTAADIQAGMLTPRPVLRQLTPRAEADAVLIPARTIGGDLYDAFMIDERRLAFLIGDVTGKGAPAALFMALSGAFCHSHLMRHEGGLAEALGDIARDLARNNGQAMELSLLAGILDVETGRLELCNAGLEDPMVRLVDGTIVDLKLEGGPPLCAAPDYPYVTERHDLPAGATLIVVTDGATEAEDPLGRVFGRARLHTALAALPGEPAAMLDGLVAAVRAFERGAEPVDDLAALALRRV